MGTITEATTAGGRAAVTGDAAVIACGTPDAILTGRRAGGGRLGTGGTLRGGSGGTDLTGGLGACGDDV